MIGKSRAAREVKKRLRSIWISDTHLGTRACRAHELATFLEAHESEFLYLVGDIFDGWRLSKRWFWPRSHGAVVASIFERARAGAKVIYLPGNHDESARQFIGMSVGDVLIREDAIHVTADGRRLMVVHGDRYDDFMLRMRWLVLLGNALYTILVAVNLAVNVVLRRLGFPYRSLSFGIKSKIKRVAGFICDFESVIAEAARDGGFDGVICGHIHNAAIRDIDGILYCNCGDWVESLTALTEDFDGRLALVRFRA